MFMSINVTANPIYKIYNSTCLSVSLLFYVCHHFSGVHPFYFNYLFVIILCCPSFLFYTYICVCHHFILSILFILPLCLSSFYTVCPFYFRQCNVCPWPTVSVANTPSFLGRHKPSKDAGRRPAIQRVCLKSQRIGKTNKSKKCHYMNKN